MIGIWAGSSEVHPSKYVRPVNYSDGLFIHAACTALHNLFSFSLIINDKDLLCNLKPACSLDIFKISISALYTRGSFVHSNILFIYSFMHSLIYACIHSFSSPFIHSFIHPCSHITISVCNYSKKHQI